MVPSIINSTTIDVRRILILVYHMRVFGNLAKKLKGRGVEIVSTGVTARTLQDAGITVKDISDFIPLSLLSLASDK